jgi:hypothetical protein
MSIERKEWFTKRIGNIVYRSKVTCDCHHCNEVYKNGIIIGDKEHANYLYDWECITSSIEYSKLPVRYFDAIKERDEYEGVS